MSGITTHTTAACTRAGRLVVLAALAIGLLSLAPLAQARTSAGNALDVTFTLEGAITMTLPDGTPVGTTSGAPTVIPAGSYIVYLQGPDGCVDLPFFILKGPGESITDNLGSGASTNSYNATFQPNSTYTWIDDQNPKTVYTFTTSTSGGSSAGSSSSGSASTSGSSSSGGSVTSTSSSGAHASSTSTKTTAKSMTLGTLVGSVSASGRLTFSINGKSVKKLAPGKYKVSVTDKSSTSGFALLLGKHAVTVTSGKFVGAHTATVSLSSGRWSVATSAAGKPAFALTVT